MANQDQEQFSDESSAVTTAPERERGGRPPKAPPNGDGLGGDGPGGSRGGEAAGRVARRSFFDIYKPGQGTNTRIGTAAAAGALVCWFAYFVYHKSEIVASAEVAKYFQVGAAVAVLVGFGLLGYWLLGLNRKVCDFLILTEGEMKKVHWTSRKEIIGATKVVIFLVVSMSVMLFVVDLAFMLFFSGIGVLKGEGPMTMLKSLF